MARRIDIRKVKDQDGRIIRREVVDLGPVVPRPKKFHMIVTTVDTREGWRWLPEWLWDSPNIASIYPENKPL